MLTTKISMTSSKGMNPVNTFFQRQAVAEGASLGGPKLTEDPFQLWFVLLWWPEDWLPPECPTPPRSGGLVPMDSARDVC